MANQANSLSHTKWICKYHIVLTPKEWTNCIVQTDGKYKLTDLSQATLSTNLLLPQCVPGNIL